MEENEYQPDKSGLVSLGGFSYQIKVFAMLATELREGESVEFETFDDLAKSKVSLENFDDRIDACIVKSVTAYQVKRTNISDDVAKNVLYNWILLENSSVNIEKYVLFTESSYGNEDLIKLINIDHFIQEIESSVKRKNANISKAKAVLEKIGKDKFKEIVEKIISKYEMTSKSLDEAFFDSFKEIFSYSWNKAIYINRLEVYLGNIFSRIMKCACKGEPFSLSHVDFQAIIENVRSQVSDEHYELSYSDFRDNFSIDESYYSLKDLREYKQLEKCKLSSLVFKDNLVQEFYYKHLRQKNLESMHSSNVKDLERTTFENFNVALEEIEMLETVQNIPKTRLLKTQEKPNSYARNDQMRKGACIYMTRDDAGEMQISWSDDEN